MKRYIVLSVNENPEYIFYYPLTCWAWKKLGWTPITFFSGSDIINILIGAGIEFDKLSQLNVPNYQSDTVAQVSRLYGACVVDHPNSYLMTGDIDMIPLSDYWNPDTDRITCWGRDLTDYHYPICYIGMPSEKWKEVMQLTTTDYNFYIQRDLMGMPQAVSQNNIERWVTDQDLITERLQPFAKELVDRGTYPNGYPIGRVDRSAWHLNHEVFIDAHLPRGIYRDADAYSKTMELLRKIWPEQDFTWFERYTKEFAKIVN